MNIVWRMCIVVLVGMGSLDGAIPAAGSLGWRSLAPIPDPIGFAGMFSGVVDGRLYAGGGSQFVDRPLWLNGTKVMTDRIFVLDELDGAWRESAVRLPVKAGYFAGATSADAIYLAGGVAETGVLADVFELRGRGDKLEINRLPTMPHGVGYAAAVVAGGRLYVAGGKHDTVTKTASVEMWSLGLAESERVAGWRRELDLPGTGTTLAAMGYADDGLYLFGGVEYGEDGTSLPSRQAHRFDLPTGKWESLPDMPAARIGPSSPCPVMPDGQLWVIGGYAEIFPGAPRDHPGFDDQSYFYDIAARSWTNGPVIPHVPPVDRDSPGDAGPAPMLVAPCTVWRDHVVIVGGEVRASVRTPAVLAWPVSTAARPEIRKVADVTIYQDEKFHVAFPSVIRRPDGELIVAFRRALDRRLVGANKYTHTDPNSHLMLTRSHDKGQSWTAPTEFYAHPFAGAQDPCLLQLTDGSILCTSYFWAWMEPSALKTLQRPISISREYFVFLGGLILRSPDGGNTWNPPVVPPRLEIEQRLDIFGQTLPAYSRGAMAQGRDGRLFWSVPVRLRSEEQRTENHLLISTDGGINWDYSCTVARDDKITFNETSIYETPKGDLVAFLRTAGLDGHLAVARSTDGGKSFLPWEDAGFVGYPAQALRLPDNRVLLVYGYRKRPYGIRARVLNAECTDLSTAAEMVLRDDGGGSDLGYPWSAMIDDRSILVTYYFNRDNGQRSIEATILEIKSKN